MTDLQAKRRTLRTIRRRRRQNPGSVCMVCGHIAAHLSGTTTKPVFGQWNDECDICGEPTVACAAPRDFGYPSFKLVDLKVVRKIWTKHRNHLGNRNLATIQWCHKHPPKKRPLLLGHWKRPIPGSEI